MPNLWSIFLTGLLTGGLTCLAVQGGLLATTIAQRQSLDGPTDGENKSSTVMAVALFLAAKLFAYTLVGFALGWLGSLFKISLTVQAGMQILVAIFMLGTAGALLNLHPFFRYFILQTPRSLAKLVRSQSKSANWLSPVFLGLLTILVPCGTTQAMMALAVGSGSPVFGALILFSFVLGTSPLFFILGFFASKFKEGFEKLFRPVAGVTVALIAFWSLNTGLNLLNSPFSLEKIWQTYNCAVSFCDDQVLGDANSVKTVENVNITIDNRGYTVDNSTIKAGLPATITLSNKGGGGCASYFTIPSLKVAKSVPIGGFATVTITPTKPGTIEFMCSMGMYRGKLRVV